MAGAAATNPKRRSGTGVSADEVRNATATTSHALGTLAATTLEARWLDHDGGDGEWERWRGGIPANVPCR